jgi:hypothetical protein
LNDQARSDAQLAQSNAALNQLQHQWGDAVFQKYRTRLDILALN